MDSNCCCRKGRLGGAVTGPPEATGCGGTAGVVAAIDCGAVVVVAACAPP